MLGAVLNGAKGKLSPLKSEANDKIGKTTRRFSASVWLATDFAIPMQPFLPILEALSVEHEAMHRMKELLSSRSFKEAADRAQRAAEAVGPTGGGVSHVFPVKISVPLNLAIRAIVHFEDFTLQPPGAFPPDVFTVPLGYLRVPRREAQKTLSRSKNRMLLAHLAF